MSQRDTRSLTTQPFITLLLIIGGLLPIYSIVAQSLTAAQQGRINQLYQYIEQTVNKACSVACILLEAEALAILGQTSRDIYRQTPAKCLPYLEQASTIARSVNDSILILKTYRQLVYGHIYDNKAYIDTILGYLEQSIPYLQQPPSRLEQYRFIFAFADALSYFPSAYDKVIRLYAYLVQQAKRFRLTRDIRFLYHYLGLLAIDHQQFAQAAAYLDSAARYDRPDWEKDYFFQDQATYQTNWSF